MANKRLNRRINAKGRSKGDGRFVKLPHYLLNSPAYRSLSPGPRALLIEVWLRHNGQNNGEITYSVREAAERLRCGKDTAAKWFQELEEKWFLKARQRGSFTYKARHATEWEITAEPYRDKPASKDFMRWNPANEIQNTVLLRGTVRHSIDLKMPVSVLLTRTVTPKTGPLTVLLRGTLLIYQVGS